MGGKHEELVKIPVYAAAWRAKPKDATKVVGRPWSVTVSVGASEGEALRARRSCHERRECARTARVNTSSCVSAARSVVSEVVQEKVTFSLRITLSHSPPPLTLGQL